MRLWNFLVSFIAIPAGSTVYAQGGGLDSHAEIQAARPAAAKAPVAARQLRVHATSHAAGTAPRATT